MSIPTVLDRFPTPPCATLSGLGILAIDRASGSVWVAFTARPVFCNGAGNVQGGFLAAMLNDCMVSAILIAMDAEVFPSTIDLDVQYLAPAKPGRLLGQGSVVQRGKTIRFVESSFDNANGNIVARATARVRITAMHKVAA